MPTDETQLPVSEVSAADLIKPLAGGMPQADQAGGAVHAPQPSAAPVPSAVVDCKGRPFDPEKHVSPPRLNAKGYFIGKGGGRPSTKTAPAPAAETKAPAPAAVAPAEDRGTSAVGDGAPAEPGAAGSEAVAVEGDDKLRLTAEGLLRMFYGLSGMITSAPDEWQPDSPAEHNALVDSVVVYMKATGKTELPPGLALSLQMGAYSAIRLARPKSQAWFIPKWEALKKKLGFGSE